MPKWNSNDGKNAESLKRGYAYRITKVLRQKDGGFRERLMKEWDPRTS